MTGDGLQQDDLIMRAKDGDSASINTLLERYREPLLRRIRLMMGPQARRRAESADFLQQVFVTAIDNLEKVQNLDHATLLRWLTTTARHRVHQAIRGPRERALTSLSTAMGALEPAAGSEDRPERRADDHESSQTLIEALETLKHEYRNVIELRDFDGRSFQEIGVELERSENAAQMLHTRAMVKLAEILKRQAGSA